MVLALFGLQHALAFGLQHVGALLAGFLAGFFSETSFKNCSKLVPKLLELNYWQEALDCLFSLDADKGFLKVNFRNKFGKYLNFIG